jgi:hypothetical protein
MEIDKNVSNARWSKLTLKFVNAETESRFMESIWDSRRIQMRGASALAALLYIIFAVLDKLTLPAEYVNIAWIAHLLVNALFLIITSALSFLPRINHKLTLLMVLAPIIATISNIIICSNLEVFSIYHAEYYMIILWIFLTSGLRLSQAAFTVLIVVTLNIISSVFFFPISLETIFAHGFLITIVVSLCFLAAYLLELTVRGNFLKTDQLESTFAQLENTNSKLSEKGKELEKFNTAMLDREMRIIELKKEANKLAKEAKLEIPYPEYE